MTVLLHLPEAAHFGSAQAYPATPTAPHLEAGVTGGRTLPQSILAPEPSIAKISGATPHLSGDPWPMDWDWSRTT